MASVFTAMCSAKLSTKIKIITLLDKAIQFANFESRAAIVVEEPDGSLSGWVFGRVSGEWKPVSTAEISISAKPLKRDKFFEIIGNDLP